jgi:hypothetical protein
MESKTTLADISPWEFLLLKERVKRTSLSIITRRVNRGGGTYDDVSLPDLAPQVRKGALLMDTIKPEWYMSIDVVKLNLDDRESCILGQSYSFNEDDIPGYDFKVQEYLSVMGLEPSDYGFDVPTAVHEWNTVVAFDDATGRNPGLIPLLSMTWETLTELWRDEIRTRLAAKSENVSENVHLHTG